MRIVFTSLLAVITVINASAQEDTSGIKELNEVVVTGQYKPQSVKNSVYQVRVITKDRIQKQAATKLQDVLNNELNMRFNQDLATGGSGITMLGLKGQNVKILIDGLPLTGRQGTSNEIDINQVDVNSIEKIEIVEGPMSVVYGADALAGVINIITKKAGASKLSVTARIHEESVGSEYGIKQGIHNQYAGLTWKNKQFEIGGSVGRNYFGGWKDTMSDRELSWHRKDQLIANGFIGYTRGRFSIRYRIDGLDEIITNPGNYKFRQQDSGDTLANDQEYLSQRVMQQLQASWSANNDFSIQAQAAYSDYNRQVFSTTVSKATGAVRLNMAEGSQSVIDFSGFTFRTTALYKVSPLLSIQPGVDINLESADGERLKQGNNKVADYAFFVTGEFSPTAKINIRPGVRFIKNSVYDAPPIIPSINTKFSISKELDLRLAYAKGFRSPSLREMYFNFFDANHQIIGNPDLQAETSNSLTGSISWKPSLQQKSSFNLTLSAYYNDVRNLIDYGVSAADPNIYIYINVAKYKTRGLNLTGAFNYKNISATAGASYTGFFNEYNEIDKSLSTFQWSPEANATIGYNFPKAAMGINLFYKYTGKRPSYVLSGTDVLRSEMRSYHLADLTINKKLFRYVTINAGVRNIFDVTSVNRTVLISGVHTAGGAANIGSGRALFAGLVFNWDKK